MANIDKNANDIDVESTVIYSKDNIVYKDVTCDTRFKTSELKRAFVQGSIIDIAEGAYGNEVDLQIKPDVYTQTDDVGSVSFAVPTFGCGKNKYPSIPKDEQPNITITGTDFDNVDVSYTTSLVIGAYYTADIRQSMIVEYGPDSQLFKTLSLPEYKNLPKTVSFDMNTTPKYAGPYANRTPGFTVTFGDQIKTYPPSDEPYTNNKIQFSVYDEEINILKIEFKEDIPMITSFSHFQIEIGTEATDYETYKVYREVKHVTASAMPDEP